MGNVTKEEDQWSGNLISLEVFYLHGMVGGTSPSASKYSIFLFFFLAQQPVSWAWALSAASDSNPSVCMSSVPHQAGGQLGKVRSRAAGGFFQ